MFFCRYHRSWVSPFGTVCMKAGGESVVGETGVELGERAGTENVSG